MNHYHFPENKSVSWTQPCKILGMTRYLPPTEVFNQQISKNMAKPLPAQLIMKVMMIGHSAGSSGGGFICTY